MEKHIIDEYMAVCSSCFHEFEIGETAYIDEDNEYICEDCN